MRLATWNVNGLRARLEFVKLWLAERSPDLVGLQELKLTDEQFPHDEFEPLGYRATVYGQKAWNGVAVLSREPVEAVQRGLPGEEEFGSRLLTVRARDLEFTTLYCPNGKSVEHDDFPKKLAWFESLAAHLREGGAEARVVGGDFNIVPAALDSWDEERHAGRVFHTDAERERLAAVFELGLADLYRAVRPDEQAFSWWDYRGGAFHRKQGLRIDLLLGTASVRGRLVDVFIDRDWRKKQEGHTASDHAPVVADLA